MFFQNKIYIFAISYIFGIKHNPGDREGGISSLLLFIKHTKNKNMNITKEQVEELLPKSVKDTDALSDDAKNMFAVLLNSLLVSKGAEDTGVLIKNTDTLRTYIGWRFYRMMAAIRELEKLGLITRKPGKLRTSGEQSSATKFIFHWDVIDKPIVKKTHEELFARFRHMKTSGNNCGNCNSNNNVSLKENISDNSNIKENIITNCSENSNVNENSNLNYNEIDNMKEELKQNRFKIEEFVRQKTKGKSYTEITRLTIPIYQWIESEYPEDSDRLKRYAYNLLYKIKMEGLVTEPSATPVDR